MLQDSIEKILPKFTTASFPIVTLDHLMKHFRHWPQKHLTDTRLLESRRAVLLKPQNLDLLYASTNSLACAYPLPFIK